MRSKLLTKKNKDIVHEAYYHPDILHEEKAKMECERIADEN